MINKELIDFISKRLNIVRRDLIEKDILLSKILFYLVQNKDFSQNYAFKGGTCLIKCYFGYFRFSEDLDFTYLNRKEFGGIPKKKTREVMSEKINVLGKLIETTAKKLDLDFKIEKGNKRYFQFGGSNAFVTFKIWYYSQELKKETFVKIQVNHIEKLDYPIKEANAEFILPKNLEKDFSFIASEDTEILLKPVKIKVYDLKEIFIEKIRAILTRRGIKARDFIDAYLIHKETKVNLKTIEEEVIKKTLFMLKYEKYLDTIKNKAKELEEELILGKEEYLLLKPLPKDFNKFVEASKPVLKTILERIAKYT